MCDWCKVLTFVKLELNRCNMQDNMQHTVKKTKRQYSSKQIEEWPMETGKGTNIKKETSKRQETEIEKL